MFLRKCDVGDLRRLSRVNLLPLMHHDPRDLGSLILIWTIPKESTLNVHIFRLSWWYKFDTNHFTRVKFFKTDFTGHYFVFVYSKHFVKIQWGTVNTTALFVLNFDYRVHLFGQLSILLSQKFSIAIIF